MANDKAILNFSNYSLKQNTSDNSSKNRKNTTNLKQFNNKILAHKILKYVDPIDIDGRKRNTYCENARRFFINRPRKYCKESKVFVNIKDDTFENKNSSSYYKIIKGDLESFPDRDSKYNINAYMLNSLWSENYTIGKDYACSHQIINQINGLDDLFSKGKLSNLLVQYESLWKDRPQCLPQIFLDALNATEQIDSSATQSHPTNMLSIEGYEMKFKTFLLIASTNPLIAYYHDGYVEWNGLNEDQLHNHEIWTFDNLQNYLYLTGKINNTNWLNIYLRQEIKKSMIHILRVTHDNIVKKSNVYQLVEFDFNLDNKLKLSLIEINTQLTTKESSKEEQVFIEKMIDDQYEILFSYLRSRLQRVIAFVNEIIRKKPNEIIHNEINQIPIFNEIKTQFNSINKNYLDPKFIIRHENEFVKIFDEELNGFERYNRILPYECL